MKIIAQVTIALSIALCSIPAVAGAQERTCPSLNRTLEFGASGKDVSQLQSFLITRGLLSGQSTGYFGKLTQKGVQSYQSMSGIVSSGQPGATGYGLTGPKTRTAIQKSCSSQAPISDSVKTGVSLPPTGLLASPGPTVGIEPQTVSLTATTNSFTASPNSGVAPLTVSFTATNLNSTDVIDFGDGQTGQLSAPECAVSVPGTTNSNCNTWHASHTYTAAGAYTAKIQRTTDGGVSGQIGIKTLSTMQVTVTGIAGASAAPVFQVSKNPNVTLSFSWSDSAARSSYEIQRRQTAPEPSNWVLTYGEFQPSVRSWGPSTQYPPGRTYEFRVAAKNTSGTYQYSNAASVTIPPATIVAPAPVLTYSNNSSNAVAFSWQDSGTSRESFGIERRQILPVQSEWALQYGPFQPSVQAWTTPNYPAGTTYEFRIAAKDVGSSVYQYSNVASINFPPATIALTFHAWNSAATVALPIMQARGLVGTFFFDPVYGGTSVYPDFATPAQASQLKAAGWEIGAYLHGDNYESMVMLYNSSPATAQSVMIARRDTMHNLGLDVTSISASQRSWNNGLADVARGIYSAVFVADTVGWQSYPIPDADNIRFGGRSLVSWGESVTFAEVKADIDNLIATGGLWIPGIHKIGPTPDAYTMSTATFTQIMDYIQQKVAAGQLRVTTFNRAVQIQ